jgi:hypothetical protein
MLKTSTPLPKFGDTEIRHSDDPNAANIYSVILRAEQTMHAVGDKAVMDVRIVGWLLIALYDSRWTLGDVAFGQLLREVGSCQSDSTVMALGEWYREALLRACALHVFLPSGVRVSYPAMRVVRRTEGSAVAPSEHPSHPVISTVEDMIKDMMEGSVEAHAGAKSRVR